MRRKSLMHVMEESILLNDRGDKLSSDEMMKLGRFVFMMKGSNYHTPIVRVESIENLKEQFGADAEIPCVLTQYLFMAGDKGRVCWSKRKFLDPDDITPENFELICRKLGKYIKSGCKGGSRRSFMMRDFYSRNENFCKALEDISSLMSKYCQLEPEVRKTVNLYYLSIAHTINSCDYKENSIYVSSTTDILGIDGFHSDVTIYGWVPKQIPMRNTIDYIITGQGDIVKNSGLPIYTSPVYPKQKEISLRCGFLPHFMVGFTIGENFYVNPAIFSTIDKMDESVSFHEIIELMRGIFQKGFEIDQSDFEDFCRKTNFKRYFTYDGKKYAVHSLY